MVSDKIPGSADTTPASVSKDSIPVAAIVHGSVASESALDKTTASGKTSLGVTSPASKSKVLGTDPCDSVSGDTSKTMC